MYAKCLKELMIISQEVGNQANYVQGGGGNTSVKLNDELMAIKASGYQLKQITPTQGFVVVNYSAIKKYYSSVDLNSDTDFEKESVEVAQKNVVAMEGIETLRPSVEVGFHSLLKKYIIHTHAVYSNILCCSKNGKELADKFFCNKNLDFIWIPYINPGFSLTLRIKEEIERYMSNHNRFPEIIFMENHGLVVSCDDYKRCVDLHSEINTIIRNNLNISLEYPKIQIETIDGTTHKSKTKYLTEYFLKNKITQEYFDDYSLYPDQLVYLNESISVNAMNNKLNINTNTGELIYKSNLTEAVTIEETLLAYLYVINQIKESGLELKVMTEKEKAFIKGWESEKYRKSLLKK